MKDPCADCGRSRAEVSQSYARREKAYGGRGLCHYCYVRHHNAGTLDEFERPSYSREDYLREVAFFTLLGYTVEQIAHRLDVKVETLQRAIYRAREKGLTDDIYA